MKKRILAVVMTAAMVLGSTVRAAVSLLRMIRQNQPQQQKQKPSAMMY